MITEKKPENEEMMWHKRLGHLGSNNMKKLLREDLVNGLSGKMTTTDLSFCEDCADGKLHRLPFQTSEARTSEILELVHSDVCGSIDPLSLGGAKYFVTFIDDFSRFTMVYFIQRKSEVFEKFKEYKNLMEKQTGQVIKALRSDNGGEYTSQAFKEFLKNEGIQHQLTIPKTPEQNGVAERMNRTVVEMVRAMLAHSKLPKKFWAEALNTAVYLKNRSPATAVTKMTPFQAFYGHKPSVRHLRIFGCNAYAHIPKDERKKLDPKSRKCRFLGYSTSSKGYRLYDFERKRVIENRDVIFDETAFGRIKEVEEKPGMVEISISDPMTMQQEQVEEEQEDAPVVPQASQLQDEQVPRVQAALRRSTRDHSAPNRYGDWVYIAHLESSPEPKTMSEATSSPEAALWKEAAQSEYNSLLENKTWDLVELPKGRKVVGCKWVFKVKHNADGSVERYKARLVAKGFTQKYGIDYDETFSPVVRFESVRALIALAAQQGMKLHQMDVTTAFLNGELTEEIFMEQPDGFLVRGKEKHVCSLKKSLYGLKQSPRCWNHALHDQLLVLGFAQSDADACIYVKQVNGELVILAVYVDDIILAAKGEETLSELKKQLSGKFKMKDLGELHYFLGVKVQQNLNGSIWLGQEKYMENMLQKYNMDSCNPVSTPMEVNNNKLQESSSEDESADQNLYQSAVGSLLYLAIATRPDISAAVAHVAKFCSNPTQKHWAAVKRIFRYIKGTIHMGLLYRPSQDESGNEVFGYSDADWAGDTENRRSTSGFVFKLAGAAISWRSKTQTVIALSSAVAEYIALAAATQEAVWLRRLMKNLQQQQNEPTLILEDNTSAISMANNPVFHGRTKHIDIKNHFVREKVKEKVVRLKYCPTKEMVADLMTKALSKELFELQRKGLGLFNFRLEEEC
ncbi:MAG: DDE-type integrase/transposase/recombinase [Gammaproteobacteria bacterium]|nr:DDE-type integrase/transposase/recombinase [Gammaproteobacteria bacterium]